MLFSAKENIFKCLVAFQKMFWKIFSSVWLCSWKYHRKHIFYLLLTFSHIFSVVKKIYNIIPQYRNTKATKPKKKNSSNLVKLREEGRERGNWVRSRGEITRRRRRRDRAALESTFAWLVRCDQCGAAIDETRGVRRTGARSVLAHCFSLGLCLWVLSRFPEVIWR